MTSTNPDSPPPDSTPPPFEREGPETEWKERLPRAERIARTMSAFANGVGGQIWVGVRDDGTPVGVADPAETIGELRRIARDLVTPPPRIEVQAHVLERCQLIVAEVHAADSKPVLAPGRDGVPTAFLRDGSSTRKAPRAVVRVWERNRPTRSLESRERRVLREIAARVGEGAPGPTLAEVAHAARTGQRAARRAIVQLQIAGLVTERTAGRYGLTPEGHARARRR